MNSNEVRKLLVDDSYEPSFRKMRSKSRNRQEEEVYLGYVGAPRDPLTRPLRKNIKIFHDVEKFYDFSGEEYHLTYYYYSDVIGQGLPAYKLQFQIMDSGLNPIKNHRVVIPIVDNDFRMQCSDSEEFRQLGLLESKIEDIRIQLATVIGQKTPSLAPMYTSAFVEQTVPTDAGMWDLIISAVLYRYVDDRHMANDVGEKSFLVSTMKSRRHIIRNAEIYQSIPANVGSFNGYADADFASRRLILEANNHGIMHEVNSLRERTILLVNRLCGTH